MSTISKKVGEGLKNSRKIPILMYHRIAPRNRRSIVAGQYVSPPLFRRHMRTIKAFGFDTVSLCRLFESEAARQIAVTFDDGYANYSSEALPVLRDLGFSATVFLVANQLGGTNAWDVAEGDVEERLLTVDEILAARRAGTEFGSHTLDHVHLDQLPAEEARRQICQSKEKLECALGIEIASFCYPYGGTTPQIVGFVKDAGYLCACSTLKGANTQNTDRYALKRINVRSDTTLPVFVLKLWRALRHDR